MAYFGEMGRFNGPFLARPEALALLIGLMMPAEDLCHWNALFRAPANSTGRCKGPKERPHAELHTFKPRQSCSNVRRLRWCSPEQCVRVLICPATAPGFLFPRRLRCARLMLQRGASPIQPRRRLSACTCAAVAGGRSGLGMLLRSRPRYAMTFCGRGARRLASACAA